MATYDPNNPSGSMPGTTGNTMGTTGTTRSDALNKPARSMAGSTPPPMTDAEIKTGGVTTAIGDRLERAGDFLEDKGKGQFLADKLHSAGKYLQDNDAKTMARSIDSAICAHPYRGILIGLGLGWVVGRFLSGRD